MNKLEMRDYIAEVENHIDGMLKKWKKISRIENGEVVQIEWQFELARMILEIFWMEGPHAELRCSMLRRQMRHEWPGLTPETAIHIYDRVGNYAQAAQWKEPLS